jgi:heat shock protein HslJ
VRREAGSGDGETSSAASSSCGSSIETKRPGGLASMKSRAFRFCAVIGLLCSVAPVLGAQSSSAPIRQGRISHNLFEGREWVIAQYYVNQELLFPNPKLVRTSRPYISFVDGVVGGSPGCGNFTGIYHKSGDALTIAAKWSQGADKSCSDGEREDAAKMLVALGNVRRIGDPPAYWHDDALVLTNAKGEIQIALGPRQVGSDLSELPDIYWHLSSMKHNQADLSRVFIHIADGDVSFSTPDCLFAFPFRYEMAGLKFFPAWIQGCGKASGSDAEIARLFKLNLQSISSYRQAGGTLTFLDGLYNPILVLTPVVPETIENRVWRIQKYFAGDDSEFGSKGLIEAKILALISFVNGRTGGGLGCGGWEGRYTVSDGHLSVHAGVFYNGRCATTSEVQSSFVEKAFQGDLLIEMTNDRAILRDDKGQVQIELVPY